MRKTFFTLALAALPLFANAQQTSDELFAQARELAFEQKDYPSAINLAQQALEQSPDYTDISVFLGRLYTWNGNVAEARKVFENLEAKGVKDADFYLAYGSLEYWNDQESKAMEIANRGLVANPESQDLLLLKAKIQNSTDNSKDAEETVNQLLRINPSNTEARALLVRVTERNAKNAVGVVYTFTHFDKQFDKDWHMVGVSYKRVTPIGSVIIRGNVAHKFGETGTQIELEAYPRISDTFYLYVGGAYSGDVGIFPEYRSGISVNANLPKSFEAEVGFRHLFFSNNIYMYTASVGKYYKNFWFNLRTYITPDNENISHSYTGTVRYYLDGAQDFLSFQAGTGISPEENRNNLLDSEAYKLKTFKVGAEYNFSFNKNHLFTIGGMYFNQEYRPNTVGNQFDVTLGYTLNF